MKKILLALVSSLGVLLGSWSLAFATSTFIVQQGGTSWSNIQAHTVILGNGANALSTTSPSTSGFVLTSNGVNADPTFQSAASGSGTVSTSTIPIVGQLSYWTSNGYPSLLGSVATSSATLGLGLTGSLTGIGASNSLSIATSSLFNSASDWAGTWQTHQPAYFQVAGNYAPFPFTPLTNYGVNTSATTTPLWAQNGLMASSTSYWGTTGQGSLNSNGTLTVGGTQGQATSTFSTSIRVGTGFVGYPEYSFNSDPNTGIDSSAPDVMSFLNAGLNTMTLTSANRVGIGMTAPSTLLEVNGTASTSALVISSLTGLLKANGTSAVTVGANGTDYTLLTAQTCGAGSFISALTAAGGSTCTAGGAGTVTSVGTGTGLTGGTITTTGTISFAPIAANSLWVNGTSASAVPTVMATSSLFKMTGTGGIMVNSVSPTLTGTAIFTSATSTTLGVSGELNFPHSAIVPTLFAGDAYINTNSTASSSIAFANGGTHNLFAVHSFSITIASSTLAYMGAYGATGTTTVVIANPIHSSIIHSIYCQSDVGTAWVGFTFGTGTETTEVQCTTTGAGVALTTNNTGTGRLPVKLNVGHNATAPNYFTITADIEDQN